MARSFPALPGLYAFLFLYFEPFSAIAGALEILIWPGTARWHHSLVPSSAPAPAFLDARSTMGLWHLSGGYLFLGLIEALTLRVARDHLSDRPADQERIISAVLLSLAAYDVAFVTSTIVALPREILLNPSSWNFMTHANIWLSSVLILVRFAWHAGIGRTSFGGISGSAAKDKVTSGKKQK
ncbi:hypothetical protein BOTBODRAFT_132888 [Botryobasidium botryosum FD-172 SS1]|uniref:DUF7704 domain-containing protein n=1 Tax=Botryobasidium botryosum (strain FD-172 SS1) TaxID=930990 RepID=A0A067MQZ8_BOTB1|nr:hypothetical protein BOTBODRAFT_132888 [Botryobasidium botryosum FD-172 SS1]